MKFTTNIKTNELFQFLLRHSYAGISGKVGLVISLAAAVMFLRGIPDFAGNETKMIVLGFLALLFTVVNPVMLYTRAKKQKLMNPAYKNAMEYELDEEGIKLYAGGQEGGIPWNRIMPPIWKPPSHCRLPARALHRPRPCRKCLRQDKKPARM